MSLQFPTTLVPFTTVQLSLTPSLTLILPHTNIHCVIYLSKTKVSLLYSIYNINKGKMYTPLTLCFSNSFKGSQGTYHVPLNLHLGLTNSEVSTRDSKRGLGLSL